MPKPVAFCPACGQKARYLGQVVYVPGEVIVMFNCDNPKCPKRGQFSVVEEE
jgi:hypothetical protein